MRGVNNLPVTPASETLIHRFTIHSSGNDTDTGNIFQSVSSVFSGNKKIRSLQAAGVGKIARQVMSLTGSRENSNALRSDSHGVSPAFH